MTTPLAPATGPASHDLRRTVVRSGALVTAGTAAMRAARIAAMVVLARLLEPEHFGLVAMGFVVTQTLSTLCTFGAGPFLVQTREELGRAGWHVTLATCGLALALAGATAAVAPSIASFYERPELAPVLRWMVLVPVLDTLAVVPLAVLSRELRIGHVVAAQLAGLLANLGLAVVAATAGLGVWSLVLGHVAGSAVQLAWALAGCPPRGWLTPSRWDWRVLRGLTGFGWAHVASTLVGYVYLFAPEVTIGKQLGAATLGFYTRALNYANLPVKSVGQVGARVFMPAYARVQEDPARVCRGFLAAFGAVAFMTAPFGAMLCVLAREAVVLVLGRKWEPAVELLRVLFAVSVAHSLTGVIWPLFLAIGRPGLTIRASVLLSALVLPTCYALVPLGARGVAAGVAVLSVAGLFYQAHLLVHRTGLPVSARDLVARAGPALLCSALTGGAVAAARLALARAGVDSERWLPFLGLGALALAVYVGLSAVLNRAQLREMRRLPRRARAA